MPWLVRMPFRNACVATGAVIAVRKEFVVEWSRRPRLALRLRFDPSLLPQLSGVLPLGCGAARRSASVSATENKCAGRSDFRNRFRTT